MTVDPDLPCGYCIGIPPCGSDDPNHEPMSCWMCDEVVLSEPHPECLRSVDEYIAEHRENR